MTDEFTLEAPTEREEGTWVPIPNNSLLSARVVSAAKKTMPYKDRDTGDDIVKVEWKFQITSDGDFNGRQVTGTTSTAFVNHDNCKMYQWVKALLGDIPEGFKFSTDDIRDLDCEIVVKAEEKERKDGKGVWVTNTVIDVRPQGNAPVKVGSAYGDFSEEPF